MPYELQFKTSAWKSLRKIPAETRARLVAAIWSLSEEPRPLGARKLTGQVDLYRLRIGDYRVVYDIQDQALVVLIIKVGHRREVYRRL